MAEHWCKEHNTKFFKSTKMKAYAHPVEGTDPTEWCNEPKEKTPAPVETTPQDNEYWERKQAIERASIEGQGAVKCLTELTIAKIKLEDCPTLLKEAIESKIRGYMGTTSTTAPPKTETKAKTTKKTEGEPDFKNVGELFELCYKKFKMQPTAVMAEANVHKPEEITDFKKVWEDICAVHLMD